MVEHNREGERGGRMTFVCWLDKKERGGGGGGGGGGSGAFLSSVLFIFFGGRRRLRLSGLSMFWSPFFVLAATHTPPRLRDTHGMGWDGTTGHNLTGGEETKSKPLQNG